MEPSGSRSRARDRDRAGICHLGQDRVRGPVRLRSDRHRHQLGSPALFRRRAVGDPHHRARARSRRALGRGSGGGDAPAPWLQPPRAGVRDHRSRRSEDAVVSTRGDLLSELPEEARNRRFDELQRRLADVWSEMRLNHPDECVVVIPSVTLDRAVAASGSLTQAYEERYLFMLMLLRQPRLRMIYVTSAPIAPEIIEYYLSLLPGIIPSHARTRLSLVAVNDLSERSLSEKLLDRPALLRRIAAGIPNPARCHLVPYNSTELERDLALTLGIPMFGADPRLSPLGSKTGCRRLFADVGVPHPLGAEDLRRLDEVADALMSMRAERPAMEGAIVKLNEGVSGAGNALVRLGRLPPPGAPDERECVLSRLDAMELESQQTPRAAYLVKLEEGAGIVEERITGEEVRSPSVQLRILPEGRVELLSTHDQLLGGASGQSYLGCTFPAAPQYARLISGYAEGIGERLAREGVLGRFAVDFVAVRDAVGSWSAYAIEV